jgi:formylglycine-generating enzyme required for sulfatase activity
VNIVVLIFLAFLIPNVAWSQSILEGKVLDAKTKLPLSRATIKVNTKGIELGADSNGDFVLQLKERTADSLEISHIGYKTIRRRISDLNSNETFLLEDYSIQLRTVTVTSRKLNLKAIDRSIHQVKGNLFAYETEMTNGIYNLFLNFLEEEGQMELFQLCDYDLSGYDEKAKRFYKDYTAPYKEPLNKKDTLIRNYNDYPVVNIRHEAAVLFCQWFTEQYNYHPGKKRFKKVKFRLPTLKEWQVAALGYPKFQSWDLDENTLLVVIPEDTISEFQNGKKTTIPVNNEVLYPWWTAYNYRAKPKNVKNCYLGNFKVSYDPQPCAAQVVAYDGWTKMAGTASYFPNGMGLYDVVGNVAEMIDEKGKALGGGWNDAPNESTIRSVKHFDKPEDSVGFRVFMEVVEP